MTTEEYKKLMETRPYLEAGTEANDCMHRMAAAAQAVTAKINCGYHSGYSRPYTATAGRI